MPHITFIHGIANKPPQDKLLKLWRDALARDDGLDLGANGVSASMVYWADVMYAAPQDEQAAYESLNEGRSPDVAAASAEPGVDTSWKSTLPGDERLWLAELGAKVKIASLADDAAAGAQELVQPQAPPEGATAPGLERIWLPASVKKKLMEDFLRDVHHYLFNVTYSPRPGDTYQVQGEIRRRMIATLEGGAKQDGPFSHSMGTVISYDCLKRVTGCPRVDALVTVGSPLGLDEVQDGLQPEYSSYDGFPSERLGGRWVNVFDHLDPVAGFDPHLADDFMRSGAEVVEDINEQNWGRWRHDATKYLHGPQLRATLKALLQL